MGSYASDRPHRQRRKNGVTSLVPRIHEHDEISNIGEIVRCTFAVNAFDGEYAIKGVLMES